MDKQKLDLARRVMAAPGFRPLPGMRIVNRFEGYPVRMIADGCFAHEGETGGNIPAATDLVKTDVPDLDDPATVGCLLALVRERWGTTAHLVRLETNVNDGHGSTKPALWWALAVGTSEPMLVEAPDGDGYFYLAGDTEAEALVAALEVAP